MKAFLKNYRQSPRKVRLVASLVKGKNVDEAIVELDFLAKRAGLPIKKLLISAVANAKQGAMGGAFYKNLKEFRLKPNDKNDAKAGDVIDVSIFAPGDMLQISSISKGKGFQGVVKRHGFHGGPRTHGQKHSEREPGSIGGGLRTHVPKGMRMAGRMGSDRITQKNLKVVFVDKESNTMLIKGAVAGKRGTLVEIVSR